MKRKLFLVLFILLLVTFISSTIGVFVVLQRYREADVLYSDLQDRYVTYEPSSPKEPPEASKPSGESSGDTPPELTDPAPVLEYAPISVNFDLLLAENSDVAGWLYCEDTPINYPVLRSADNEDYLHRDLNRKYLYSGSLFTDYRCEGAGIDRNHIIYGHNMKNDTMFGTLDEWADQEYYEAHPVLWLLTPEQDYKIEVLAAYHTTANSDTYLIFPELGAEFSAYITAMAAQSVIQSAIQPEANTKYVLLSTCADSYSSDNKRFVVHGKLTPVDSAGGVPKQG